MVEDRYGFLGVCHNCGGPSPDAPYCSTGCRSVARLAVDAGITRELPAAWLAVARHKAAASTSTDPKRRTKVTPPPVT